MHHTVMKKMSQTTDIDETEIGTAEEEKIKPMINFRKGCVICSISRICSKI